MKAKFWSELAGTAFLLMIVVGSGIMAQNLFPNHNGLALLANSIATGAGLFVLIQSLGPISGCHLNPAVSLVELLWGRLTKADCAFYVIAQFVGAYVGILLTHIIFNHRIFEFASVDRSGWNIYFSEVIATFGLISVIGLSGRKHVEFAPISIAAYIVSAYWFTSSTSFANPAVTFGRMFTNTFCGIDPGQVVPFVGAQILGGITAYIGLKSLKL
jgi:glycerol uptake facilitator-like aquaporin